MDLESFILYGKPMTVIEEWDYSNPTAPFPSRVSVEQDGQCLNFIYENTVVPSPYSTPSWEYNVDGHILKLSELSGNAPDSLELVPLDGWQFITEPLITVPDWSTGIITICQYLLG